jgi:hypothetical protein
MNDRPTALELVAAARQYLEGDLLPSMTDARLKFQTLIAANVLAITERELLTEEEHLLREWEWLADLVGLARPAPQRLADLKRGVCEGNEQLCEHIRRGDFDDASRFRQLLRQLRRVVERKLQVANPRYLASFNAPPAGS